MAAINLSKNSNALQTYTVPWCPKPYSNAVSPDLGPPSFAIDSGADGSVVARLQRQVAYVAAPAAGQPAPTTTCSNPATFTTAAYTNVYTLVPPSAAAQGLNTYTMSGYACQGPMTWKMLPYSYDTGNGVVIDDGEGTGAAVAAALRLQVPYVPSGVAGAPGCLPTVFTTQAVTDYALLAGTLAAPTTQPVGPTSNPTAAPTASPTSSPTAAPAPSGGISTAGAAVAAGLGGVLLGALVLTGVLLYKRHNRKKAAAAEAARLAEQQAAQRPRRSHRTHLKRAPQAPQAVALQTFNPSRLYSQAPV